ncbi:methyltransferase [Salinispora oceanensis]|uniref:methyltransferase n=1 Tax=Salinispora oceanensis TaxID=1050199 RepID=UPI00036D3627|nr:methyltransferase [Salinispora oceanensis]
MEAEMTGVVGPAMAALPPHLRLLLLTDGKRISQVIHVLAELKVADELADGPRTVADLAKVTSTDTDALRRVLRVAASFGVFAEEPDGRYVLTPVAEALRTEVLNSQRDLVLFNGDEMLWRSYGELMYTLRTGRPAFDKVYGRSFFAHLAAEPAAGRLFDRAMTQMSRATSELFINQYDFSRFTTLVDIGGGTGLFLTKLLRENPTLRGVLFDRPAVVANAHRWFDDAGVTDRATVLGGDFFGELPPGHDAYVLKAVLHDWHDPDAVRILRQVHQAMAGRPDSRLLICEFLVAPANQWDRGKLLDLDMLLRFGGRERNLDEWRVLLAEVGFRLLNEPVTGRWAVLECQAVTDAD